MKKPNCPKCGEPMTVHTAVINKWRCRSCRITRTLSDRSPGRPAKGGRSAAVRRYNERKHSEGRLYRYVIVDPAKRSESRLLTIECFVACIEARSRQRAVQSFAPGYQAVLYSSLRDREKRAIAGITPESWLE